MRLWVVAAIAGVLGLLVAVTADCSGCGAPCVEPASTILHTNGYAIISATSSCKNIQTSFAVAQHDLVAAALPRSDKCTFDVVLDDGELLAFDVPFTKDAKRCCCGDCTTLEAADFTTITISAPAGYVPDAGAD